MRIHHLIYRLLLIALSPIILGYTLWLSLNNRQSRYFWQRLGFNYSYLPTKCLWFHCASVGEVNTLLPLLKNLHAKNHQLKFIITSNTITGGKIVTQQGLNYLFHSYLPIDWLFSIKRFLSTVKPASLYVMETEIWPNLFTACNNKKIPVYIINARLSSKTTSANNWIKSLLKSSLLNVNAIYARSEKEAEAYKQLGAMEDIVKTVGNLKFTAVINSSKVTDKKSSTLNREYVLVASTHHDEEKQIYNIWKELNRNELLIIAPRHPERSDSIIKQLACKNIAVRSKSNEITDQTEIFLLDTVGELKSYFPKAKLVIMGGSFAPIGGHNILEPASFNRAIITGPFMQNFKEELELMLDKKAIIQIKVIEQTYAKLQEKLTELLDDENYRTALQNNTTKLTHKVEKILEDYSSLILPS
jgi:3-deoxy-D-manno-octulosonic-acid transferase